MLTYNYSLYILHFPKYWFVHDESDNVYSPALEKFSDHKSLIAHISAGDYATTLASILRFFEETIKDKNVTPKMREVQLDSIRKVMSDLLYINKNYKIEPREDSQNETLHEKTKNSLVEN